MVQHIGYLHISETYSLCYRENPFNFRIFHRGKRARKEDGGGRWWMLDGCGGRGWWLGIVGSGCWWPRMVAGDSWEWQVVDEDSGQDKESTTQNPVYQRLKRARGGSKTPTLAHLIN